MNIKRVKYILVVLILGALILGGVSIQAMASSDELVFGMIASGVGIPYINAFIQAAQVKAEKLGVKKLVVLDAQMDSLKIMEMMDTLIVQKIDGFILAVMVDQKAILPGVKRINEAGIPFIAFDTCPEGGKVDMFIQFDIEQSSVKATEAFIQGIKDRNEGKVPEGFVIQIVGDIRDMFTVAASKGFKSVIDKYPQLTVAQGEGKWNNIDSHDRTADLLTRCKGKVLGVYCETPDIMGIGTITAIEAAGLDPKDYGVCGICIGPEGLELIKQGKLLAVAEQPVSAMGELAIQYLYNMNTGVDIPKIGETVVEEGALWSPARIVKNQWTDEGATMILQGPLVPLEVSPDDPRLWENKFILK